MMDKIEAVDTSMTVKNPSNLDEKKDSSQLHTETQKSVSPNSLDAFSLQVTSVNHRFTRPNSVPLPTTKENVAPNRTPVTKSQSVPQKYSINNGLKCINEILINQWTCPDNSKNTSFSSSAVRTISINETALKESDENFNEPVSFSTAKGTEQPVDIKKNDLSVMRSSSDSSFNKTPEEVVSNETKYQTISASNTSEDINDTLKLDSQATRRTDSQSSLKYPELKMLEINLDENEERLKVTGTGTIVVKSKDCEPNQSLKSEENCQSSPDKEENKVEVHGDNENRYGDSNITDGIWMNYVERPLLPLKPLQKQRSLSCTNLVQTIKGFSKRKSSANRFSSPDNTIVQKKEICSSEVNIFNMFATNQSVESTDNHTGSLKDVDESFMTKDIYQSFEHHTWYHLVEAKEASKRLLNMHQNGAFLIRPASHPTNEVLHTLCVVFSRRVYNFHVKILKDGRITLGGKRNQKEIFSTLLDMIKYHQLVPISINVSDEAAHVHLLITPSK